MPPASREFTGDVLMDVSAFTDRPVFQHQGRAGVGDLSHPKSQLDLIFQGKESTESHRAVGC